MSSRAPYFSGSHQSRLEFFKNRGFNPQVIFDIGAYKGEWTQLLKPVFPNAKFYMFEANPIHSTTLNKIAKDYNKSFPDEKSHIIPFISLLGNKSEIVSYFVLPGGCTGDSAFKENTSYYSESQCLELKLKMETLNNLMKEFKINKPDLVKIDAQGSELIILEGMSETISDVEFIILEVKILQYNLGAPLLTKTIATMDNWGFQALDILEFHYLLNGYLNEIDIMFVRKGSKFIPEGLLA